MQPLSSSLKESLERATEAYEGAMDRRTAQYLQARGINQDTAERFRLGAVVQPLESHEQYGGRLAIPSLGLGGRPYGLKFRCIEEHSCKEEGHGKYLGPAGQQGRLFNVRAIHEAGGFICITEGELDAVILGQLGIPAVGVPGADGWKRHHPRMMAGFSRVFIFEDGDDAGRKFSRTVNESILSGVVVRMGEGKDVNSIYLESGGAGIRNLMGLEDE